SADGEPQRAQLGNHDPARHRRIRRDERAHLVLVFEVVDRDPERVADDGRRACDEELPLAAQPLEVREVLSDDAALLVRRLDLPLGTLRPQEQEPAHDGNTTSARVPSSRRRSKLPCSSSRTSACTIESPVPSATPAGPSPSSAMASTTSPLRCVSSMRTAPE